MSLLWHCHTHTERETERQRETDRETRERRQTSRDCHRPDQDTRYIQWMKTGQPRWNYDMCRPLCWPSDTCDWTLQPQTLWELDLHTHRHMSCPPYWPSDTCDWTLQPHTLWELDLHTHTQTTHRHVMSTSVSYTVGIRLTHTQTTHRHTPIPIFSAGR